MLSDIALITTTKIPVVPRDSANMTTDVKSAKGHTPSIVTKGSKAIVEATTKIPSIKAEDTNPDSPPLDDHLPDALPTPIKGKKLAKLLKGYNDAPYIINGFSSGFKVGHEGSSYSVVERNSSTVYANPNAAQEKVDHEVSLGRIAGPFVHPPMLNLVISPLALRKKANSNKYRLLHNLSAPYDNSSVNINIPDTEANVKYATLRNALEIIINDKCLFLAKSDIADALRLIPLHPSDFRLMGFKLNNRYYFDKCLPMGCRSSCKIFERFSDSLLHILSEKYNVTRVVKVIDDFLFLAPTAEECQDALLAFKDLAKEIGLPIADHKTVGPSRIITFLGIEINTVEGSCKLPPDKLENYLALTSSYINKRKISMRDAKSLLGKLSFASAVIPAGRTFLRRLYDLTSGKYEPNSRKKLKSNHRKDLKVWCEFLNNHSGKSLLAAIPEFKPFTTSFLTDSCPNGYAGICHPLWFQGTFPGKWRDFDIQFLELYPIFLLITLLAEKLKGERILVLCDNQPIVHTLNKLTTKNKRVMRLIRMLILVLLKNNIVIFAKHIPGKQNVISDFLSRHQATPQFLRHHGLSPRPLIIPNALRPQNFKIKDL